MRNFDSLSEKEVLALAIALEEEDARIYDDLAEGFAADYPGTAEVFRQMARQEDGHRRRLLGQYRQRFGEHIPLVRRQDVKGFVSRRPVSVPQSRPVATTTAQTTAASSTSRQRPWEGVSGCSAARVVTISRL